jgi:hypothetical protein
MIQDWGLGESAFGVPVPGGDGQLTSLPWPNLNRVSVRFSQNVSAALQHLRVWWPGGSSDDATAFAYDPETYTATWTLPRAMPAGRVVVRVGDAAGLGGVAGGVPFDGEWADGAGEYPSGDGEPGGAFAMALNVRPGDVDRNGTVNALDVAAVRQRLGASVALTPDRYNPFLDLDGDGRITALDLLQVRKGLSAAAPAAGLFG